MAFETRTVERPIVVGCGADVDVAVAPLVADVAAARRLTADRQLPRHRIDLRNGMAGRKSETIFGRISRRFIRGWDSRLSAPHHFRNRGS